MRGERVGLLRGGKGGWEREDERGNMRGDRIIQRDRTEGREDRIIQREDYSEGREYRIAQRGVRGRLLRGKAVMNDRELE